MSKKKKKRARRRYSAEFKVEAIRLVRAEGASMSEVARNIGVGLSTLHNWVKQADTDGAGAAGALTTDEQAELRRLRKENRTLRMEREILKKATAFFARES